MAKKAPALVTTIDLTTTPPWDITGLGDYSELSFVSLGATGGKSIDVQPSSDGGSTFDTTTTNYWRTFARHSLTGTDQAVAGFRIGGPNTGECTAALYNFNLAARSHAMYRPGNFNNEPFAYAVGSHQNNSTAYNALRVTTSDGLAFSAGTLYVYGRRDPVVIIYNQDPGAASSVTINVSGYASISVHCSLVVNAGSANLILEVSPDGGSTWRTNAQVNSFLSDTSGSVAAPTSNSIPFSQGGTNTFHRSTGMLYNVDMSIPTVAQDWFQTNNNASGRVFVRGFYDYVEAHNRIRLRQTINSWNSGGLVQVTGVPNL